MNQWLSRNWISSKKGQHALRDAADVNSLTAYLLPGQFLRRIVGGAPRQFLFSLARQKTS